MPISTICYVEAICGQVFYSIVQYLKEVSALPYRHLAKSFLSFWAGVREADLPDLELRLNTDKGVDVHTGTLNPLPPPSVRTEHHKRKCGAVSLLTILAI
jgi:hypothetical protein